MIATPGIAERREDLVFAIMSLPDLPDMMLRESLQWQILQLRIDLLMAAVEHAARVAQISEDYESMWKRLK